MSQSQVHPKLLISQSKFSGPRKFTLRYLQLEITELKEKQNLKKFQTLFFEISVFEISRVDCISKVDVSHYCLEM